MIQNKTAIHKNKIQSWSRAICICCAISGSLLFFRVAMRLSHDTSTPFPASHSLRTSLAITSGLLQQFSEITAILFPRVSWSRNVPKSLIFGPTREGKSISSSCSRSGFAAETVRGREQQCHRIILLVMLHSYLILEEPQLICAFDDALQNL